MQYAEMKVKNIKWCFFDVRSLISPAVYMNFNFKKLIKYMSAYVKKISFAVCEKGEVELFIIRFGWRKCLRIH